MYEFVGKRRARNLKRKKIVIAEWYVRETKKEKKNKGVVVEILFSKEQTAIAIAMAIAEQTVVNSEI